MVGGRPLLSRGTAERDADGLHVISEFAMALTMELWCESGRYLTCRCHCLSRSIALGLARE
jgi:hypothetical protein